MFSTACVIYKHFYRFSVKVWPMHYIVEQTGGDEVSETVKFVRNMDRFFDCLNVSNFTTGYHKRKVYQNPYTSKNDFRLKVIIESK